MDELKIMAFVIGTVLVLDHASIWLERRGWMFWNKRKELKKCPCKY